MRVLLVEDDISASRGIALTLKSGGIVVDEVDNGKEALEFLRHYDYDIVLLDLLLPDIEGYEVVKRMRHVRIDVPVLVISGLSRPQAKIKALTVGADDFISKPFDKGELIARIQAIIRRSKGFSHSIIHVGHLAINIDCKEVSVCGLPIKLTGKEYSILELLVLRKGLVLARKHF